LASRTPNLAAALFQMGLISYEERRFDDVERASIPPLKRREMLRSAQQAQSFCAVFTTREHLILMYSPGPRLAIDVAAISAWP
jgi:hypothetical protein